MRTHLLLAATLALCLSANAVWPWTGGAEASTTQPAYATWSKAELQQWLEDHKVPVPTHTKQSAESELRDLVAENWYSTTAWTYDQYAQAQRSFMDMRDTAFDKWDESKLREFLLRQGVVAPKGPREQLVMMAKNYYLGYEGAAKSLASSASTAASEATAGVSKGAESLATKASSAAAQAETEVARAIDRSKDYVWSTWDDSQMRAYLESKGLLKTKAEKRRDEMVTLMEDYYNKATTPAWGAWSDSYMHEWLVSHDIIKSDFEKNRDQLRAQLERYYYTPQDRVWSTWSDSELRQWLVEHGITKGDTQVSREKMQKMVEDNYLQAKDVFWSAWSDNQIRQWLIDQGYLRSDAQVKRDELIKLANEQYTDTTSKTAAYLTWPDARLRAFLREHGVDDSELPGTRPGLLQETRIRWIQVQNRAEAAFNKVREIVNEGVGKAEDALHRIVSVVSNSKDKVYHSYEDGVRRAQETEDAAKQRMREAEKAKEKRG
ncbi:hypothetical protein P691DRAFT_699577, partial [Macrolepiota fuliginosa MF-IS2]